MLEDKIKEIQNFKPLNAQEKQDQKVLLEYMDTFLNIFERENNFAHMTSSPWILNKDGTKVLMIYHNIYDSWGWCGGHCDGDMNMLHVAVKEGLEETGLCNLTPLSDAILAIDILPVPPHTKKGKFVSAHVHLNVTYACIADELESLQCKPDENSGVRWVSVDEIDTLVREKDMLPVYHKLMEKSKALLKG